MGIRTRRSTRFPLLAKCTFSSPWAKRTAAWASAMEILECRLPKYAGGRPLPSKIPPTSVTSQPGGRWRPIPGGDSAVVLKRLPRSRNRTRPRPIGRSASTTIQGSCSRSVRPTVRQMFQSFRPIHQAKQESRSDRWRTASKEARGQTKRRWHRIRLIRRFPAPPLPSPHLSTVPRR